MFPDWLNGVFAQFPMEYVDGPKPAWARGQVDFRTEESKELTWEASEIASLRNKRLCHDCNTGWMEGLEGRSQSLLRPMILGRPNTLNLEEQITVATWTAKTAMVIESSYGDDGNFSIEERRIVMNHDRPPHSVRIHAAAIEDLIPPLRFGVVRALVELDGAEVGNLHIYTIQINTLVLQIIRYDPPPPNYGPLKTLAVPADIEIPVFPPVDGFFWPPKNSLDNEGYAKYVVRGQSMPTLPRTGPNHAPPGPNPNPLA